ncbi:MAG: glycosyltransferase family 2 protein [Owenweeksia sp.]|nr:glycosyltransferase family 2 protein [Owenweeksia sp.]
MPKVSVIIPNFNHAQFLPDRIESILAQSYTNYELIILDDASTDHSTEVINSYAKAHPEIRVVLNKKNSGSPFVQWNRGADLAKGDYLWFAESDDYCEPVLLETLVGLLEKNPNVGLAYSQSYLVNEKNDILNSYQKNLEFIYKSKTWESDFIKKGMDVCREWLIFHNPIPNASGALLRKSVFYECGKAETSMTLNGDWYLYAKMMCRADLAFVARHLNYFRVHPQTQRQRSRSSPGVYSEIIRIVEYIEKKVPRSEASARQAYQKVSTWWQGNLYYHRWD